MANTITAILAGFGTIIAWILSQMAVLVALVLAQPLLFIPIGVVATSMIINMFRKLF